MKDGQLQGCGIRVIGGNPNPTSPIWKWIDVSVNVYENGRGLVKIVSSDLNSSEIGGKSVAPPKPLTIQSGWLKGPGKPATTPIGGKTAVSDDGASLLYGTDLERDHRATSCAIFKGRSGLDRMQGATFAHVDWTQTFRGVECGFVIHRRSPSVRRRTDEKLS